MYLFSAVGAAGSSVAITRQLTHSLQTEDRIGLVGLRKLQDCRLVARMSELSRLRRWYRVNVPTICASVLVNVAPVQRPTGRNDHFGPGR